MFYGVFLNILGLLIFLFVFWKKLKEDYISSHIFSTSFYVIFLVLITILLSHFFIPSYWFWLVFLAFLLGIVLGKWRFDMRFYETYEAGVISILPWLSFIFLLDAMKTTSWYSFCGFLFIWALVLLYVFLNLNYKSFSWYRSGKVGFCGLAITFVFFLARIPVAIFFPFVLSLSGSFEILLSGLFSFLSILLLFILSR